MSAHCIPKEKDWLKNLVSDLEDEKIAGVYGKQVPTSSSHYLDKRDLFLTFGNDKRVQEKDSFFIMPTQHLQENLGEISFR